MTYASQDQLIDRYGSQLLVDLTDRAETATGVIDAAVVTAALEAADAMIDGYLAGTYALPLATVPPLVSDLASAIAIWRLHTGIPGEKIKADYEDARRSLEQISKGTIKLSVAGIAAPGTGTSGVQVVDRDRPFTADNMTGFI